MRYLILFLLLTVTAAEPALLGEWSTGSVSSIQYRDRTTGSYAPPSGNTMTYKFHAGGAYEQSGLMQFSMYNCTSSYYLNITGRYELSGDLLRLTPVDGTFDSKGNCGGQTGRRPANKVVTEVRVLVTGAELTMIGPDGKQSLYHRR